MLGSRTNSQPPAIWTKTPFGRSAQPYTGCTVPIGAGGRFLSHSAFRCRHVLSASKLSIETVDVDSLPLPSGSYGLPIVGEQLEAIKDPDFAMKRVNKYGPIFKSHFLGGKSVFICGIENIQEAMSDLSDNLLSWDTWAAKMIFGEKSCNRLNGDDLKFIRKAAFPAFNGAAVHGYVPAIVERAVKFMDSWAAQDSILFNPQTKEFAFDITVKSIIGMSHEDSTEEELLKAFNTWWKGFFSVPINLPFTTFGRTVRARHELGKLIQKNIEKAKNGDAPSGRALTIMLGVEDKNGRRVTDKELEDTIFLILVAGYDTTASAMSSVLLELARHPEVLAKVRSEQEEVISKFGPDITGKALEAMPYLEAVIKESMRVTPVIGLTLRKAANTMAFKGFKIPKGWNVIFSYGSTIKHLDARWPGDTQFNPDRFLTETGRKPGAFVPFGVGVHSCLGNIVAMVEMKILFTVIARAYDFEIGNHYPELSYLPMPEPVDGLPVKFTKRRNAAVISAAV